jgi:UDP-N-acetylmuramate--alanine ligase
MAYICIDDTYLSQIVKTTKKKVTSYGVLQNGDISAEDIKLLGLNGSNFDFVFKDKILGRIELSIIGMHNVLNSLPAIGIALNLGVDFSVIKKVITEFKGAERRFRVTHLDSDIFVVDDYAHHPTEIKATLKIMENAGRRIVACFQPHRYSRTKYLREEFGNAFSLVDYLIITDIYSAFETPIDGVSSEDICDSVRRAGHMNVHFVPRYNTVSYLMDIVLPGDAVFILGAGDIGELPEKLVEAFEARSRGVKVS